MTPDRHRAATLAAIAHDIRRCADALAQAAHDWPQPTTSLSEQLWELSEARKVQLDLATWDEAHGYHESAEKHRRTAADLKERAMQLLDTAE